VRLAEIGRVHELALTESVVQAVRERLDDQRVVRVRLQIGRLMAVVPEAMRFCFDVCSRGTPLEGARLEIDQLPARGACRSCGVEGELEAGLPLCRCGSADVAIAGGDELRIVEVELAVVEED
jgi:hydrogenase nickel incorporation protein HypA/HybF